MRVEVLFLIIIIINCCYYFHCSLVGFWCPVVALGACSGDPVEDNYPNALHVSPWCLPKMAQVPLGAGDL